MFVTSSAGGGSKLATRSRSAWATHLEMVLGAGLGRTDLRQVRLKRPADLPRDHLCVAGPREIGDEHLGREPTPTPTRASLAFPVRRPDTGEFGLTAAVPRVLKAKTVYDATTILTPAASRATLSSPGGSSSVTRTSS